MKYTTENIQALGTQIMEILAETLGKEETGSIQKIETKLRELLRELGAEALGQYLTGYGGTPVEKVGCECGGEAEYQRKREATVISVFGRVKYKRGYYAGCQCGQGQSPVDKMLGLTPGGITAGLKELITLGGIELSFEQSERWLEKYLLFSVSENTIRAATEERGEQQQRYEEELKKKSEDVIWLQARTRDNKKHVQRIYGSIDAAKVRIEPRNLLEKEGKTEEWRDMKVGCWYELECVPSAQRSTRQEKKYEREQQVFRAKNLRYYCDIEEAKSFGKLVWATGCQVQADMILEIVFVCDGAVWIWHLVSYYYPKAVQIVDWYHALTHLEIVAALAFPDPAVRKEWLKLAEDDLWNGQVQDVILACQELVKLNDKIQQEISYFENNAHRMQYASFRAAGYAIGSGTVESACKQIVTQRLKKSGAQWIVDGAVYTAKARAAWLSGESHWNSLPLAI